MVCSVKGHPNTTKEKTRKTLLHRSKEGKSNLVPDMLHSL